MLDTPILMYSRALQHLGTICPRVLAECERVYQSTLGSPLAHYRFSMLYISTLSKIKTASSESFDSFEAASHRCGHRPGDKLSLDYQILLSKEISFYVAKSVVIQTALLLYACDL